MHRRFESVRLRQILLIERLARNVRRLADHCPVLMLQGTYSYEPPGTLSIFRLLGGRFGVHVADRIKQVGLDYDDEADAIRALLIAAR